MTRHPHANGGVHQFADFSPEPSPETETSANQTYVRITQPVRALGDNPFRRLLVNTTSPICFNRADFVSSMDLDDNDQVDDAERKVGEQLFDQIAGKARDTFTAEDYKNFAQVPANLTAAAQIPKAFGLKPQKASEMLAHAAKFELDQLLDADPDHKLSARAQVLENLFLSIKPEISHEDLASRLWATIPGDYLSNHKESIARLTSYIALYPDDYEAQANSDLERCTQAQLVIFDMINNYKEPTAVTITVLDRDKKDGKLYSVQRRVDKARIGEGKIAAQDYVNAANLLEGNVAQHPGRLQESLENVRKNRDEMQSYLDAFSKL
jgi:hypothetical protein